ncbi:unnamed protein product [Mytilus coruscus]|uniref:Uncharacterized protein n=1 Tax=Mytilus coruscus TaxID=42192 RepID=A0A6J8EH31_MYTCO|nr:unnamed protein product [Mytilus coruscus]
MLFGSIVSLSILVYGIRCDGAGPPGSAPHLQPHGGAPGSIGTPGSQLVFPPNPDFGQLLQVDDIEEANAKHIFSDPRGPLGLVNEHGEYIPLQGGSAEIRSKNTQLPRDHVEETDWHKVEVETGDDQSKVPDNSQNRAGILYNMFKGRHQPGPNGQQPQVEEHQSEPQGPPRV